MERSSVKIRLEMLHLVIDDLVRSYAEKREKAGQDEKTVDEMSMLDTVCDLLHECAHLSAMSGNFKDKESFKRQMLQSFEAWLEHAAADLDENPIQLPQIVN